MENLVDKIDKVHEQLISEEGINVKDLPTELQRKIKGWNLLFERLTNNPEDEKLFVTLQKQSVEIADKIQNFIETDFDDDNDDAQDDNDGASDDDVKKPNKQSNSSDKKEASNPVNKPTTPKRFGNLVMEKKILQAMNGSERISITQLEAIIGKEPDYPEQEVNNITLRKVFMASADRLI